MDTYLNSAPSSMLGPSVWSATARTRGSWRSCWRCMVCVLVRAGKVMGDELDPETPALVSVAQAHDPAGVYCGRPSPQKGMTSLTCVPLLHSILHPYLFILSRSSCITCSTYHLESPSNLEHAPSNSPSESSSASPASTTFMHCVPGSLP